MTKILETVNSLVWGVPALLLILGVGLYISIRTGFVQLRLFPMACRDFLSRFTSGERTDGISPFQALCTALAATVGTGNLAGVAGAIAIGGPGSIFWMWICAILGMGLKFAEAALAVRFRRKGPDGTPCGGPMYMIESGLGRKLRPLASLYSFFGIVAAFGVGNGTQINAVITGIHSAEEAWDIEIGGQGDLLLAAGLAVLVVTMLLGGAKRIGEIAEFLVPFAAIVYIALGIGVLTARLDAIPDAFAAILHGAYSPRAVTGGVIGSGFQAMRVGISRGVFTNEAGMGTASMAHGGADVKHPADQGLMGIMEVFLDTVVICTMTALVILCSGTPIHYGADEGLALTARAFSAVYGDWVSVLIALETCCFAFATILGWGLYGARCAQYLFGDGAWRTFAWLQGVTVILSAMLKTGTVWILAEIINGLMAVPNLITLALLTPELINLLKTYPGGTSAKGGTYAYFHQRKPLRALSHAEISPLCREGPAAGKDYLPSEHRSA